MFTLKILHTGLKIPFVQFCKHLSFRNGLIFAKIIARKIKKTWNWTKMISISPVCFNDCSYQEFLVDNSFNKKSHTTDKTPWVENFFWTPTKFTAENWKSSLFFQTDCVWPDVSGWLKSILDPDNKNDEGTTHEAAAAATRGAAWLFAAAEKPEGKEACFATLNSFNVTAFDAHRLAPRLSFKYYSVCVPLAKMHAQTWFAYFHFD